jgi:hypothetical protein
MAPEDLGDASMPLPQGKVHGRKAVIVSGCRASSRGKEKTHNVLGAALCRQVQGRPPLAVGYIEMRSVRQKHSHDLNITPLSRVVERTPAGDVSYVRRSAVV